MSFIMEQKVNTLITKLFFIIILLCLSHYVFFFILNMSYKRIEVHAEDMETHKTHQPDES